MNRTTATAYQTNGSSALAPRCGAFTVHEGARRPDALLAEGEPRQERLSSVQKLQALALMAAVLIALGLTMLLSDAARERAFQESLSAMPRETITVHAGDSLWSIAQDHAPAGTDTAFVVRWISQENNLDSALIVAGQDLIVPSLHG